MGRMDRIKDKKDLRFGISNLKSHILLILTIPVNFLFPPPARAISFEDVSAGSGLVVPHVSTPEKRYIIESMSGGAALLDCDSDGRLDVAAVLGSSVERFRAGGDPFVTLYRQAAAAAAGAAPKFEDVTRAAGLARKGWGMGVTAADYDDDGLTDLFVTGYGGNALYRAAGPCRYEDVTERAGVRGAGFATGAAWADYDRDGDLDLFVARYVSVDLSNLPEFGSSPKTCTYRGIRVQCGPRGLPGETDLLYRNRGDGTFEEASAKAGVADERKHYGMQPAFADYDDDGWPDLFVANDATYNYLYRNNRDGTFREVGAVLGVAYGESGSEQGSMGATWGDFDLDGRLDLFVSNFEGEPNALYRNLGTAGFADVTLTSRIGQPSLPYVGWGTAFVDFDNDGLEDLLVANGHVYPQIDLAKGRYETGYRQHFLLFRNAGGGRFDEVSGSAGLRALPMLSRRGAAFGDINDDGLVDAVVINLGEPPTLLLNTTQTENESVTVRLARAKGNRAALGARVTLRTSKRLMTREAQAGASYLSQNDARLHFGLGRGEKIERVEVRWPGGETEAVSGVEPGRAVTVTQGKGLTASLPYRPRPALTSRGAATRRP
ncbi:MAG TPA: CRTAC1 family protein [Pyrinomonadaceae bacterium]|nr:CRTAC1 family protein [Pyrinomonadaceae bacterium]